MDSTSTIPPPARREGRLTQGPRVGNVDTLPTGQCNPAPNTRGVPVDSCAIRPSAFLLILVYHCTVTHPIFKNSLASCMARRYVCNHVWSAYWLVHIHVTITE